MLKVGPAAGLEQLTLLARSACGVGAAKLVRQALEAPGVLVFGKPTVLAGSRLCSLRDISQKAGYMSLFGQDLRTR
jgi:hypothetical protein